MDFYGLITTCVCLVIFYIVFVRPARDNYRSSIKLENQIRQTTKIAGRIRTNEDRFAEGYIEKEREKARREQEVILAKQIQQREQEEKELEKKLKYIGGWDNHDALPLEKALKLVPNSKCCVYKLSIGGSDYIGFTSQDPNKRLEHHLKSARENSKQKVHVQLRKFGFIYDFEIISKHENEVLALVAEISNIKKHSPELNMSIGGEGNTYKVFEKKSLLGELIFFVSKNDLNIR